MISSGEVLHRYIFWEKAGHVGKDLKVAYS